jgi:hypothetical protein
MFAQIITGRTSPLRSGEIDHLRREQLASFLQQEQGFSGTLNLVDLGSTRFMMIVLWETQKQAETPLSQRGTGFQQALLNIADISVEPPSAIAVWKVALEL